MSIRKHSHVHKCSQINNLWTFNLFRIVQLVLLSALRRSDPRNGPVHIVIRKHGDCVEKYMAPTP